MNIVKVSLENFKCFNKVTLDLPQQPGLYLFTGDNKQQAALGSNGIGKSTLFDAILWCIYGKTSKGIKAGKLLNRNGSGRGYGVQIVFDNGQIIERAWNPNSLKIGGKEVEQPVIDSFVQLSYEQFLQTLYFCQNRTSSFIDLTSGEKLTFLSQIFALDKWIAYSDLAKKKALEESANRQKYSNAYEVAHATLDSSLKMLLQLEEGKKKFEADRQTKINALQLEILNLSNEIETMKPLDASVLLSVIDETKLDLANALKRKQEAKELVDKHLTEKVQAEVPLTVLKGKIRELQSSPDKCSACKQPLDVSHIPTLIADLEVKIPEMEQVLAKAEEMRVRCLEACKSLDEEVQSWNTKLAMYAEEKGKLESANRVIDEKKKALQRLLNDLEAVQKQVNTYDAQIVDMNVKIVKLSTDREQAQEAMKHVDQIVANFTYWTKTFPLIRLKILNNVVDELELHFNQLLSTIGLIDWSIKLETERELKNETVKPELTVKLFQKDQEIEVDSLSGGELQRIRMILSLGLSTLIKNRIGMSCDLLMVDEPMQALSSAGIELMLETLDLLSQSNVILLAEHRVIELTKFAGVYEIIKNQDGNSTINANGFNNVIREPIPAGV